MDGGGTRRRLRLSEKRTGAKCTDVESTLHFVDLTVQGQCLITCSTVCAEVHRVHYNSAPDHIK